MIDELHMARGVRLVLAMMRSASTDKIDPRQWWLRARTALETGAASAQDFATLVSTMGRKIQIDVTTTATAEVIASLAVELLEDFESFRRVCEDRALYIVAIAQSERAEERSSQSGADQRDLFAREAGR